MDEINEDEVSDEDEEMETNTEEMNKLQIKENEQQVFALSYSNKQDASQKEEPKEVVTFTDLPPEPFLPHTRRSALMQVHKGILYVYGGCIEAANEKEISLCDMHCLNVKKMDEWKTLFEDKNVENIKNIKEDDSSNGLFKNLINFFQLNFFDL